MSKPLVVIIDDDDAYRYAIARQLAREGFDVIDGSSYSVALAALGEGAPVAFLLADIKFPEGVPHGISAALMARNRNPKLPIAFMTAFPEFMAGELTKGIGEVFMKPLDPLQIGEHIRRSLVDPRS